jgi:hypothetical protein
MERSGSIAKLAEALSKAQGELEGAKKAGFNPYFRSKYADLESTWDACRPALAKHGLSVVQMPFNINNTGMIGVETILMHESGEWISGSISLRMEEETNPQNAGSILTYLRRYSLQGAVGIAPEDDDANAAAGRPVARETTAKDLDEGIVASLESADSLESLKAAWAAIPASVRPAYAAIKDSAKARIQSGTAK